MLVIISMQFRIMIPYGEAEGRSRETEWSGKGPNPQKRYIGEFKYIGNVLFLKLLGEYTVVHYIILKYIVIH